MENEQLVAAFDPEIFRREGHRLIDLLAEQLKKVQRGRGAVSSTQSPAEELAHWEARMREPLQPVAEFLAEVTERSIQLHHPRYMGHQVCAPAPSAALAGLASELLNNGMAIYEMGPAATALEHWVIGRSAEALGFEAGAGFLTSGGTLATLTALLGARARQVGDETFTRGTEPQWAVLVSEEAHYCVSRAVQVMGWGSEGVIRVATDERFKMRTEMLGPSLEAARRAGRTPIAVVGSACTTSTGSFDPLGPIADFCAEHRLWFHVDGAHGGALAFCPQLRHRLAGVERADSVILDFHKLLLTPALATAVIFRERNASWAAFHQRAQYLWDDAASEEWHDVGRRSFECTKLSMSVKIAALFRCHGEALFAEHLRVVHSLAGNFAARLRAHPSFELAVEPESNIVCFRYRPAGVAETNLDALNREIRRQVIGGGEFYIVQTLLRERVWLRTSLMNSLTQLEDLDALLAQIEQLAGQISAAGRV